MGWLEPGALAVVWTTGFGSWISFALFFGFVCCSVLVFTLSPFLYIVLYVLEDNSWISMGFFMQTKHIYVYQHWGWVGFVVVT